MASIHRVTEHGVVSKNLEGVISSWNPAVERIYGIPRIRAIGQS